MATHNTAALVISELRISPAPFSSQCAVCAHGAKVEIQQQTTVVVDFSATLLIRVV